MTMPWGSTEEPDVIETEKTSIPVRVVSTDARPGKSLAPEFGRWRTFLVTSALGNDLAVPGARRIANRSLRRHRIHIIVNSSVATGTFSSQFAEGSVTSPAALTTLAIIPAASLPVGTYSISVTVNLAGTAPVQATDANNFKLIAGGFSAVLPNTIASGNQSFGPFTVPLNGGQAALVQNVGAGTVGTIYTASITAIQQAQPLTDGVIVGGREEIAALVTGGGTQTQGNPLLGYTPGGYLQIGDNVRYESQQELWVAYPASNSAPVIVSTCDEVYASDPDSWKGREQ